MKTLRATTSANAPVRTSALNPLVTKAEQAKTFGEIFRRLDILRGNGKRGVVQIDLDLAGLMPTVRTRSALKAVSQRFGIPELTRASPLPGYTDGAWQTFLGQTGLEKKYPAVDWSKLYREFRTAYWYGSAPGASRATGYVGLEADAVTPGLVEFVKQVRARGGEVVFNSGRGETAEAGSRAALTSAGIEKPILAIGSDPNMDGGQVKAARQKQLDALGVTVAVLDDRQRNRDALGPEAPHALFVAMAIPGFTVEAETRAAKHRASTFEL